VNGWFGGDDDYSQSMVPGQLGRKRMKGAGGGYGFNAMEAMEVDPVSQALHAREWLPAVSDDRHADPRTL